MSPSVSLVSPIYNDLRSMPRVLRELKKLLSRAFSDWEIFLIDDGSTDGSRQWIRAYAKDKKHIRVLFHEHNLGIAKTYRHLYAGAKKDVAVLFSLDGEWNPRDAVALAKKLTAGDYDVVVGVRKHKSYTFWRMVISWFYNLLTGMLFGVVTHDAGSIKALKREVIEKTPVISYGVFDEAERIIRAKRSGYRIGFMDVHHSKTNKKRRGIGFFHVLVACIDTLRVFWDSRL